LPETAEAAAIQPADWNAGAIARTSMESTLANATKNAHFQNIG
jgi:hypothetical protein